MAELVNSWEQPIDTGEVPQDGQVFDAIVVGGGPGGSSAAGYLARLVRLFYYSKKVYGLEIKYAEMLLVENL